MSKQPPHQRLEKIQPKTTRRDFIKKSATATAGVSLGLRTLSAVTAPPLVQANDKIRMGFIGVGNRGSQLLTRFMANDDVAVVALCDVYEPYTLRDRSKVDKRLLEELGRRIPTMGEKFTGKVDRYNDFRKLLDRQDIDAVCIATPDHWHAIQTITALKAGKDVYVEKPLSITIHEGREMVRVAEKTDRIVQVGLHRRSSPRYKELADLVQGGVIGQVSLARAYRISNMYPDGIGQAGTAKPPEGFDWDLWLGPRAKRPYQYNIAPYKFRWWKDYSSQMGNWGVHYMDASRWVMGELAPVAITAHGTKRILKDDRTIPDTMEVTFEFASGAMILFGVYEASGGPALEGGEIEFRGTKGNIYSRGNGYKIVPTSPGQFQDRDHLVSAEEQGGDGSGGDLTSGLIRNFLDCVHSREQAEIMCDLETGHRSTSFALLANIALETGLRLEWDPKNERFTNGEAANKLLHYKYRKPWSLG